MEYNPRPDFSAPMANANKLTMARLSGPFFLLALFIFLGTAVHAVQVCCTRHVVSKRSSSTAVVVSAGKEVQETPTSYVILEDKPSSLSSLSSTQKAIVKEALREVMREERIMHR